MIYTKTYENGLRLIFEKNKKDVACCNIMFNVGSQNESVNEEGYAHFIEHMIFKGTKKITAFNIMDKLTFWGADYNAYTSKSMTKFLYRCLNENFENCFELYSNMLIDAEFDSVELDKEKQVVIEEMKKCDDEPVEIMYKIAMENYFSGLSFAHDELGREEIIENVTREELMKFKNKFYTPENCVISVVGNFSFEFVDELAFKYFASRFKYKAKHFEIDFTPFKINISKKYDIVNRNDNQANVCLHIKSVSSGDKSKYIADLYTCILGSSQNSRLFKTIREELGLVYSIYAYNEISSNSGEIMIVFGTRPKNLKKAMVQIKKVIENMAEKGITEEEFIRAKNWKKSCFFFGSETNLSLAEINGTTLSVYDKVFSMKERIRYMDMVKIEEINEFAKRIACEKTFNIVAVGKNISIEDLKIYN